MADKKWITVAIGSQPILYKGERIAPYRVVKLPRATAEAYIANGAAVEDFRAAGLVEVVVSNDAALSPGGHGGAMSHYRAGWRIALDPQRAWYMQRDGEIRSDGVLTPPKAQVEVTPSPVGLDGERGSALRSQVEALERELAGYVRSGHEGKAELVREQLRLRGAEVAA